MARLDRRNFLGLFSAAALAAIAPIGRLVNVDHKRFTSPVFGFSFDIPDGWFHLGVEEIIKNRDRLIYVEEHRTAEELSPTPMIAFSRYKEPHPDLNPGVCIYGDRRADWMGDDLVEFADSITHYFSTIVKSSEITRSAIPLVVSCCESVKTTINYDLRCADGFCHRVTDDFLLAFHRDYLIFLQFEQSQAGPERAECEFRLIEETLRFM
jgi:hypothetical protein